MSINSFSFSLLNSTNSSFFNFEKNRFYYDLPLNEIHVWFANITEDKTLSKEKLIKKCSQMGYQITRYLLSNYLECSSETILFEKEIYGKPTISQYPEISFNISHSNNLLLIAISRQSIGIDLEEVRSVRATAIAKKFFPFHEKEFLKKNCRENLFFELWTAKEASLKADGRGITQGLRDAHAKIEHDKITSVCLLEKEWMTALYSFFTTDKTQKDSKKCFVASVASSFSPSLISWYDFDQMCRCSSRQNLFDSQG